MPSRAALAKKLQGAGYTVVSVDIEREKPHKLLDDYFGVDHLQVHANLAVVAACRAL